VSQAQPASAAPRASILTNAEIIKFYIPLAATTMFYAVIFNVMNSAMAKTFEAAAALAAFSVGQSIADIIAVPAGTGNQWLLARGRDKRSFGVGLRVMFQIIAGVTVLLALAGWTGFGTWLYQGVFNAPPHLSDGIAATIRVCLPLPIIFTMRGASQSVLMLRRKTHLMTAGVVLRLVYIVIASAILPRVLSLHGGAIGGILWVSGMAVEGLFALVMARRVYRQLPDEPEDGAPPPANAQIWAFLLPLIASSLMWSLGKPILNLGMARSADPETAIATYQVAWNAAWLLIAYVQGGFRQVVVVFWNDERSLRSLQAFAMKLAAVISVAMLTLTITGVASWFLRDIVGAADALIGPSKGVLLVLSTLPLALVATEVSVGRLLRNGTTGAIGLAKGANLAAMALVVFGMAVLFPGAGAMIGAFGLLAGAVGEFAVAYWATKRIGTQPWTGIRAR